MIVSYKLSSVWSETLAITSSNAKRDISGIENRWFAHLQHLRQTEIMYAMAAIATLAARISPATNITTLVARERDSKGWKLSVAEGRSVVSEEFPTLRAIGRTNV